MRNFTALLRKKTHAWEQRKLGDLGKVEMCKRIFKDETSENGDIPFFKIGTFGGVADAYISKDLFEEYKSKYPYPKPTDILISASGTIGRTVVYNGENAYFQDSNIVWLNIDKSKLLNAFLFYIYQTLNWESVEGSTIKRLYNSDLLATTISLPTLQEQQKIGVFFTALDRYITIHQRKWRSSKLT